MKLAVVIVCYKVADLTIDCLRSLAPEIARVPGARAVVVENGTGGDSADRLRAAIDAGGWGAWCDLVPIHPNLGFTGGNNVAIRRCLGSADPPEYVMLLNADTIVLEDALPPLVDFLEARPRVGIVGARCVAPVEGDHRQSYARFQGVLSELDRGMRLGIVSRLVAPWTQYGELREPRKVDWVPGAAMVLRRSMLDRIGLLDEGLYTYFDDLDICLRARRAGWETWYVPGGSVVHIEGASTGVTGPQPRPKRLPSYWFEARRRYFLKSYGPWYAGLVDAAYIAGCASYRLRRRIQRKPDTDPPHLLADSIRQSVFRAGFRVREVRNPALRGAVA